jgi:hypothetical protein
VRKVSNLAHTQKEAPQVWFWRLRSERELVYRLQAEEAQALERFATLDQKRFGCLLTCVN